MESFTSSSSSSSSSAPSSNILGAAFDDCSDDFCSICLEPFGINDPATITRCKHEYHLHCILEWSQRSTECPICMQSLSLIDPSSQELLAAMGSEKRLRSRNIRIPLEWLNEDSDYSCSDDSDVDDRFMQHLLAATRRAHLVQRRERQRSSGAGPSEVTVSNSAVHVSAVPPTHATSPSVGSPPTFGVRAVFDIQPPTSAFPLIVGEAARNTTTPENDVRCKPRVIYNQPPPENGRRLNTSEMFSIPESFKSKFSAASSRYKESISKSTRGLKEKLIARNASVKELSKGVQREMNAGIAGVARMIERLDLTSKRSTSPLIPVGTRGTSGFPVKGKSVQENDGGHSSSVESENVVQNVSSDAPSPVSSVVADRVEIPPLFQNGHDAVKT